MAARRGEDSQKLVADLHPKIGELTVDLDSLKKFPTTGTMNQLRELVDEQAPISIRAQCGLLGLSRSAYYYEGRPESAEKLALLRRLDELPLEHPVYGSRKLTKVLEQEGRLVNRKRVVRCHVLSGELDVGGRVIVSGQNGLVAAPARVGAAAHSGPDTKSL